MMNLIIIAVAFILIQMLSFCGAIKIGQALTPKSKIILQPIIIRPDGTLIKEQ